MRECMCECACAPASVCKRACMRVSMRMCVCECVGGGGAFINGNFGAIHHYGAKMEVLVANGSQHHCSESNINANGGAEPRASQAAFPL